jgi:hypothetical protein
MATRAELRARCRTELGDPAAAPVWSDDQLNQWIEEAIRDELTFITPLVQQTSIAAVADQRGYALPAGCRRVAAVEHPPGVAIEPADDVPGYTAAGDLPDSGYRQAWRHDRTAGRLVLRNPPTAGEEIVVRYLAAREPIADDVSAQPVEAGDLQIVALLACRRAWDQRRLEEAKRGRRAPPPANPFGERIGRLLGGRRRLVTSEQ